MHSIVFNLSHKKHNMLLKVDKYENFSFFFLARSWKIHQLTMKFLYHIANFEHDVLSVLAFLDNFYLGQNTRKN